MVLPLRAMAPSMSPLEKIVAATVTVSLPITSVPLIVVELALSRAPVIAWMICDADSLARFGLLPHPDVITPVATARDATPADAPSRLTTRRTGASRP